MGKNARPAVPGLPPFFDNSKRVPKDCVIGIWLTEDAVDLVMSKFNLAYERPISRPFAAIHHYPFSWKQFCSYFPFCGCEAELKVTARLIARGVDVFLCENKVFIDGRVMEIPCEHSPMHLVLSLSSDVELKDTAAVVADKKHLARNFSSPLVLRGTFGVAKGDSICLKSPEQLMEESFENEYPPELSPSKRKGRQEDIASVTGADHSWHAATKRQKPQELSSDQPEPTPTSIPTVYKERTPKSLRLPKHSLKGSYIMIGIDGEEAERLCSTIPPVHRTVPDPLHVTIIYQPTMKTLKKYAHLFGRPAEVRVVGRSTDETGDVLIVEPSIIGPDLSLYPLEVASKKPHVTLSYSERRGNRNAHKNFELYDQYKTSGIAFSKTMSFIGRVGLVRDGKPDYRSQELLHRMISKEAEQRAWRSFLAAARRKLLSSSSATTSNSTEVETFQSLKLEERGRDRYWSFLEQEMVTVVDRFVPGSETDRERLRGDAQRQKSAESGIIQSDEEDWVEADIESSDEVLKELGGEDVFCIYEEGSNDGSQNGSEEESDEESMLMDAFIAAADQFIAEEEDKSVVQNHLASDLSEERRLREASTERISDLPLSPPRSAKKAGKSREWYDRQAFFPFGPSHTQHVRGSEVSEEASDSTRHSGWWWIRERHSIIPPPVQLGTIPRAYYDFVSQVPVAVPPSWRTGPTVPPTAYLTVKVDEKDVRKLHRRFPPRFQNVPEPHITLIYEPTWQQFLKYRHLLGRRAEVAVFGLSGDERGEVLLAAPYVIGPDGSKSPIPCASGLPHLTLSHVEKVGSRKAKANLFLAQRGWTQQQLQSSPIAAFSGKVGVVTFRQSCFETQENAAMARPSSIVRPESEGRQARGHQRPSAGQGQRQVQGHGKGKGQRQRPRPERGQGSGQGRGQGRGQRGGQGRGQGSGRGRGRARGY